MGQEQKARPNLKSWAARAALASDVIALVRGNHYTESQIQNILNALATFLNESPVNLKALYYPGRQGNFCNGCGGVIDQETGICPQGTDHIEQTCGACGIKPDPIKHMLDLCGRALNLANRNERSQQEIAALFKAMREFKNALVDPQLTPSHLPALAPSANEQLT